MYEHNAFGYWSGLPLCLTKVRSSRARCPATALIGNNDCHLLSFQIVQGHSCSRPTQKDIDKSKAQTREEKIVLYSAKEIDKLLY